MTTKILLFGLAMFLLNLARLLLHKKLVVGNLAGVTPINCFVYFMLGFLVGLPFLYPHITTLDYSDREIQIGIACSVLKGIIFLPMMLYNHVLRDKSMSSSVFIFPIALGASAFLNNTFFGENLTELQFYSVLGIGLVSIVFYLIGHITVVKQQRIFVLSILILTGMIVLDQNAATRTNWYAHMFFAYVPALLLTIMYLYRRKELKKTCYVGIFSKLWVINGILAIILEYIIIYSMFEVMPVSLAIIFLQAVVPLLMIYSAYKWHEGNYKEQASFGLLVLVLMFLVLSDTGTAGVTAQIFNKN